ncbi:hypothetical protein [Acinetobacter modestus]|uniref:hypothetical protein n=1 Tax=Acinetobacter modestus TaxID=1776740 RepID=UPI001F4B0388|nr:hypothetical protein [Acinetobacter modestus]MCH7334673.1 hypothetical protein [Acinetobacter modestus]
MGSSNSMSFYEQNIENIEEVERIVEVAKNNIDEFKNSLDELSSEEIEENISPASRSEFNQSITKIYSNLANLTKLINELKEYQNTDDIFEELSDLLYSLDIETGDLIHSSTDIYKIVEINKLIEKNIRFLNSKLLPIRASNEQSEKLIEETLEPKIKEIEEKIKDFDSLRLALEHRETSLIYLELHDKYKREFDKNNKNFFNTLMTGVVVTLVSAFFIDYAFSQIIVNEINFWFLIITIKILIVTITITLCTLFLRRASHAKKLYEQAYQTHVEINAFPIHVRSLKDEDKHELIKELALKYFGKELDQSQNDKIGDLMQDQLAAGTELIKASAELVKSVKPSSGNVDSGNDAVK